MAFLPKNEKRKVTESLTHKIFLYGEPYVGKTTFATQFPEPVILSTDGNYKFLDTPAVMVTNAGDLAEALQELDAGDHTFKTVILDVVDHIYENIRRDVLEKNKAESEKEMGDYGEGYNKVREPFKYIMHLLCRLDMNVVIIGHSQREVVKDRLKRETTLTKSKLPDKLSSFIEGLVDYTMYMEVEQEPETCDDGTIEYIKRHIIHLNTVNSNQQGGSRIHFKEDYIDADYNTFIGMVKDAIQNPESRVVVKKETPKAPTEVKPVKALKTVSKETTEEVVVTTEETTEKTEVAPKRKPLAPLTKK